MKLGIRMTKKSCAEGNRTSFVSLWLFVACRTEGTRLGTSAPLSPARRWCLSRLGSIDPIRRKLRRNSQWALPRMIPVNNAQSCGIGHQVAPTAAIDDGGGCLPPQGVRRLTNRLINSSINQRRLNVTTYSRVGNVIASIGGRVWARSFHSSVHTLLLRNTQARRELRPRLVGSRPDAQPRVSCCQECMLHWARTHR